MKKLSDERDFWDSRYDWKEHGDEWSAPWGSVELQWFATIWPRIQMYLPTKSILEIGPGYGRWSQFLKRQCERLELVDFSAKCIEACARRFEHDSNVACHVNDGMTLDSIETGSIDFVFSFDSLVHSDERVIASYLGSIARILRPNGVAFIHHSNLGECLGIDEGSVIRRLLKRLSARPSPDSQSGYFRRTRSMSARRFLDHAKDAGLACIAQEIINWKMPLLIDCISTVRLVESGTGPSKPSTIRNTKFFDEAHYWSGLAGIYGYRPSPGE